MPIQTKTLAKEHDQNALIQPPKKKLNIALSKYPNSKQILAKEHYENNLIEQKLTKER